MKIQNSENLEPQTIMQAFRIASKKAGNTFDNDVKIKAYDKVINFCSRRVSCSRDKSLKTRTVLGWAYQNMANAYFDQKLFDEASLYFYEAFETTPSLKEKVKILQKLVLLRANGQQNSGLQKLINLTEATMTMLEKDENSLQERCENVLALCQSLMALYKLNHDEKNLRRIKALHSKTLEVAEKLKEH